MILFASFAVGTTNRQCTSRHALGDRGHKDLTCLRVSGVHFISPKRRMLFSFTDIVGIGFDIGGIEACGDENESVLYIGTK